MYVQESVYNAWLSQEHHRATLESGMPVSCLGERLGQYACIQKGLTPGWFHIVSSGFSTGTEVTGWVLGHAETP